MTSVPCWSPIPLGTSQSSGGSGSLSGRDRLGHLELRQHLTDANLAALLRTLYSQGYAPWQAELPGLDMNFTEMTDMDTAKQKDILQRALEYFLQSGRGEATLMLAPAAMLQLFTLTLRQSSRTLVVDVAAYQGGEGGR